MDEMEERNGWVLIPALTVYDGVYHTSRKNVWVFKKLSSDVGVCYAAYPRDKVLRQCSVGLYWGNVNKSPTQTKPCNTPAGTAGYSGPDRIYLYGSTGHQLAVPISGDPGRVFFRFDMGKFSFW